MHNAADRSLLAASPWWCPEPGTSLLIQGGRPLVGTYPISGAKNAVLPLMVSALLTPHLVTLHNVPASLDVAVLSNLLHGLGVGLNWSAGHTSLSLTLCADHVHPAQVDGVLVERMRASVLLLGALLGRCRKASLPMPGGDAIGLRGIDFHVAGFRAMGAEVDLAGGVIHASAPRGLRGAEIVLPQPSVGATENLLLAAVLAKGRTVIRNAAREPEVTDLAYCLTAMGTSIEGVGSDVLTINGDAPLTGAVHTVMPDRIELGTMACAAAMTDGEMRLEHARADLLGAAAAIFAAAGVMLEPTETGLIARRAAEGLTGTDMQTRPYPGFATDLQSPVMAMLTTARGASAITETIFEQRFRHVDELRKMGANIAIRGRTAWVRGVEHLTGARVTATDVRAAAALVLAGLSASGETVVDGLDHLDRGYDRMAGKLVACGAAIARSTM
ncbi:UDP-N-acetylglucosamine 1-carboxyvinyltransferase [Limobrevibacterium gyesilva]|uniref:UDP-N-acetylglucosamine 1-carboxyvinyltransferase n=1 Tax=Limobrevibacterium gyesilva TaxID=2991712 RepID=A0AA41YP50_9PROT|nr:UDP-N-acetylglucosamine 1-carboxyvinyltransferase [Limobrevibacterium gyesilva]MCW3476325.1 UDP-N-acetylglucosamine 1-carboxyvinyltransferase [Limobrevibacterium gyesilva]